MICLLTQVVVGIPKSIFIETGGFLLGIQMGEDRDLMDSYSPEIPDCIFMGWRDSMAYGSK